MRCFPCRKEGLDAFVTLTFGSGINCEATGRVLFFRGLVNSVYTGSINFGIVVSELTLSQSYKFLFQNRGARIFSCRQFLSL